MSAAKQFDSWSKHLKITLSRSVWLSGMFLSASSATTTVDTYPRQPVDVQHYRFALTLSDSTDRIVGRAAVRLRLLADTLTRVSLDLADATAGRNGRGMRAQSVAVNGTPAAFTHADDRLTITLPRRPQAGGTIDLTIDYAGIPADGLQIGPNKHGDRGFFSDNWPNKARQWLPTLDHISDKATMEMDVTAPSHYQVISNGRRVEESDLSTTTRRTVWHESVPIAPWLYVLGVARFAVQHVGDYNNIPLETWVFAQDREKGFYDYAVPVKDAVAFYSEFVGPYSYEKLANVQSNSASGGMEAASAIFYSPNSVVGDRNTRWRNVIIHEIAHQWFGNAVTERDWNDVWLSEGFATYFTLLFVEHAYGRDEFTQGLRASRNAVLAFYEKTPNYRVVHDNLDDMAQVTTRMTYEKGAWVLHMLRRKMGDDKFWAGIRAYYRDHKDANASTADFRLAMERASGLELGAFFDRWLYQGQVPKVEGAWTWDAKASSVRLDLKQTQGGNPFVLEIDIAMEVAGGARQLRSVVLDRGEGSFVLPAPKEPVHLELDPGVSVLSAFTLTRR